MSCQRRACSSNSISDALTGCLLAFQAAPSSRPTEAPPCDKFLPVKVGESGRIAESFGERVAVDLQLRDLHKMKLATVMNLSLKFEHEICK